MKTIKQSFSQMINAKSSATAAFLMAVAIGLAGCGKSATDLGKPLEISGKVTMDGKPSAGVQVLLTRTTPGAAAKERDFAVHTNENGEYTLKGVFPANYMVRIAEPKVENPAQVLAFDTGPYVRYGTEASPLTADVSEEQRDFTFNLTSK